MKELEYPFDPEFILRKKKMLRRVLLASDRPFIEKNIAILGGSTTSDIKLVLELFLLNYGIKPTFYESEYNQFYEDAVFGSAALDRFAPDIIFIHTSNRNIVHYPAVQDSAEEVDEKLNREYERFLSVWTALKKKFNCPVIQNNFEYPVYRLLGNMDVSDIHGRVNFITRLNMKFADYARENSDFFIHDIHYLSARYGLDQWADAFYWHMYKYALAVPAIPVLAYSVANIIKSLYGKNKKAFALDLDNTLWGGVVGDDGVENLSLGQETSMGQAYTEFQQYLKAHKDLGVLLNVVSKNEEENAIAGLRHPDSALSPEDFIVIQANWEPKSRNLVQMAEELNLLPESFVFVDDNPAEREIVRRQVPDAAVPELTQVEHYIKEIDHSGFFEATSLSGDDLKRNEMYKENLSRAKLQQTFESYEDYLRSLNMKAVIRPFESMYMSRIAQLTNKSNQYNLTTRRCTQEEIERFAEDPAYMTLYGKLEDCFGDNGVVTVVVGKTEGERLDITLWLMSCRVLRRDMEYAMMDTLVKKARSAGIKKIAGYYYPTAKNGMVKDFYALQGFTKISEDDSGNTVWELDITQPQEARQQVIAIETEE